MLAAHLAEEAARQGIRRFSATMLGDNRAAHRLMARTWPGTWSAAPAAPGADDARGPSLPGAA